MAPASTTPAFDVKPIDTTGAGVTYSMPLLHFPYCEETSFRNRWSLKLARRRASPVWEWVRAAE